MKFSTLTYAVAVAAALLLPGCVGGSSSAPSSSGTVPGPAPTRGTPGPGAAAVAARAIVTLGGTPGLQSSARRTKFVSSSTASVVITIGPVGGGFAISTTTTDISPSSPACVTSGAGGARTCTVALNAPQPGQYQFQATTYDLPPVGGVVPAGAHQLGQATTTGTIAAGQQNTISFFVGAFANGFGVSGPGGASSAAYASLPADGAAHTYTIGFVVTDADGNPITGGSTTLVSAVAVTLAETGGSGHGHLVLNGTNVGTAGSITKTTDALSIQYDGGGAAGYSTTTTFKPANSASTSTLTISPLFASGGAYFSAGTITYTGVAQTDVLNANEVNAPSTISYNASTARCAALPGGSNPQLPAELTGNVAGGGATATVSMTLNVTPVATAGCSVTVSDNLGSSVVIPVITPTLLAAAYVASNLPRGVQLDTTHVSSGIAAPLAITQFGSPIGAAVAVAPGSPATLTVSEANDSNGIAISSTTCAPMALISPSSLPAGTFSLAGLGSSGGAVTLTATGTGTCTVTINDNNGGAATSVALNVGQPSGSTIGTTTTGFTSQAFQTIAVGSDGNLWLGAQTDVVKVSPSTGAVIGVFTNACPSNAGGPMLPALGPDGAMWYLEAQNSPRHVCRVATNGASGEFSTNNAAFGTFYDMVAGSDGYMWITNNGSALARLSMSGSFTPFTIPGIATTQGIVTGVDGNLWVTDPPNNQVVKISPATQTPLAYYSGLFTNTVNYITSGPDGNIWVTEQPSSSGRVAKLVLVGSSFAEFSGVPGASCVWLASVPSDSSLWCNGIAPAVDRISTNTGGFLANVVGGTGAGTLIKNIVQGPDGNVWLLRNSPTTLYRIAP